MMTTKQLTKQDKIGKGIAAIVHFNSAYRCKCGEEWRMPKPEEVAIVIIKYLHSQGYVLKVKRDLGGTPVGIDDWSKIEMVEVVPLIGGG